MIIRYSSFIFSTSGIIQSVPLLELSLRSGDRLEEGQRRSGMAIGDFRSGSSEETDEKTKDV